jgi:hypothetical protein
MLLGLGIKLSQLLSQALLGLRHLLSLTLELVTLDHLGQVEIEQPSLLPFELSQDLTKRRRALPAAGRLVNAQPPNHLDVPASVGSTATLFSDWYPNDTPPRKRYGRRPGGG